MKEIDKIIKSTTPPKSKDVLWDNGKELLINRNGKWENANTTEIKEGSIPFSALAKDAVKDMPVVVGNYNKEPFNRFKYILDNDRDTVCCIMNFGDMSICGKIVPTYAGRHQIIGVVIFSATNEFKEGDGIKIGGEAGEFLAPLCDLYAEVTSCGLTYENTTSINPVVWKYLCNPFILQTGRELPDELLTEDRQDFKYKLDGMYSWIKGFTVGTKLRNNYTGYGTDEGVDIAGVVINMEGCGNELIDDDISNTDYDMEYTEWNDYFTTGIWKIRDGKCYIHV